MTNEDLAIAAQGGDQEALHKLWENVRCLCFMIVHREWERLGSDRCAAAGITLDDLKQEVYFAFLQAVKAFDFKAGFRFTSYLKFSVKNVFVRACGSARCKRNPLNNSISLDVFAGNAPDGEENAPLSAIIPDLEAEERFLQIDTKIYKEIAREQLEAAMWSYCTPPQREILRLRYFEGKTVTECMEELQLSKSAVCCRETSALQALRRCPMWKQLYALLPHEE